MDRIPVFRPFFDKREIEAVASTIDSRWIGLGPRTSEFESKFASYLGSKEAVGVSSCTEAIQLALMVSGIGSGCEVIVPSMTFAATSHAVLHNGATPVLVDCDPETFCIEIDSIESSINDRTKAIIPVHYGGHPCHMEKIIEISKRYDLVIIEDVAHSLGASISGQKVGTFGDFGAFSFQATKSMTTGEGGMLSTNNTEAAAKLRSLRWFGIDKDTHARSKEEYSWYYEITDIGLKANMNDITASIGLVQLEKLESINSMKKNIAESYNLGLDKIPQVRIPVERKWADRVYWNYVIYCKNRNQLSSFLSDNGISTSVHYMPVHLQPVYKKLIEKGSIPFKELPNTEDVWDNILSIPMYPELENSQIEYIISKIVEFYKQL